MKFRINILQQIYQSVRMLPRRWRVSRFHDFLADLNESNNTRAEMQKKNKKER